MPINDNSVVSIHYTLTVDGQTIDSSEGGDPLTYTQGQGQMIPGLEAALAGQEAGDTLAVDVAADDAYGNRDEELVVRIPKDAFPEEHRSSLEQGMRFSGPHPSADEGSVTYTLITVEDESVIADANHPLAGQDLHFDLEVVSVAEG